MFGPFYCCSQKPLAADLEDLKIFKVSTVIYPSNLARVDTEKKPGCHDHGLTKTPQRHLEAWIFQLCSKNTLLVGTPKGPWPILDTLQNVTVGRPSKSLHIRISLPSLHIMAKDQVVFSDVVPSGKLT